MAEAVATLEPEAEAKRALAATPVTAKPAGQPREENAHGPEQALGQARGRAGVTHEQEHRHRGQGPVADEVEGHRRR